MDELLARQVPQSLEAEQSVLGSMLIDSRCVPSVIGLLHPEDFFLQQNRDIFETIYSMFNFSEVIDPITVLNKMKQRGVYDEQSTSSYLMQLMEITPTAANVLEYAAIVRDKSLLRNISQAGTDIVEMVQDGSGTASGILESAEKKIYALRKGSSAEGLEHIGTVLVKVFDRLAELSRLDQAFPGLSTGLRDLDKKINGLNKSDLVLIAARPGMGKSSIALNIALSVAKKYDQAVVIFNLEMSREQLALRLLSTESFVDNQNLVTGHLSEDEWNKISMAATALSQTDIRIDDNPSVTVVSEISRALKIMAKELNVPVICLSQLSRANESRPDKRPILSDLRESGAIEQDADEVMFLYRDDYYNPDTPEKNVAECIIAKNRHGETGTVKLQWLPQYTTFADREWKHDEG